MIKRLFAVFTVVATLFCVFACSASGDNSQKIDDTEYEIKYADNDGYHSIFVKHGDVYSLQSIPQKSGYTFAGLFNAEQNGVKYVDENGMSVSSFKDGQNIVLYPKFEPNEYTVILDYQGADVSGIRLKKVYYGDYVDNLPTDLTIENGTFVGWFTEPDKQGVLVSDKFGGVPPNNMLNERNFDLSDPNGNIYLYAGFKGQEYELTLYYDAAGSTTPEKVNVEYGTDVSKIVTDKRVNGKAVIAWSTQKNDTAKTSLFDGKITGAMTLYAVEYAPVIELETNGGKSISPIVKRAGESVRLPVAEKENYVFAGWEDQNGDDYTVELMPEESVKVFARWQAKIVLEENGGSVVEDVSLAQGSPVELPVPEKAGYIFAGWYDANGRKYNETSMPAASIKLYAKYYKVLTVVKNNITAENEVLFSANKPTISNTLKYSEIDLTDLQIGGNDYIEIAVHAKIKSNASVNKTSNPRYGEFNLYNEGIASDAYLLLNKKIKVTTYNEYFNLDCSIKTEAKEKLYFAFYLTTEDGSGIASNECIIVSDLYFTITYPETSKLY